MSHLFRLPQHPFCCKMLLQNKTLAEVWDPRTAPSIQGSG